MSKYWSAKTKLVSLNRKSVFLGGVFLIVTLAVFFIFFLIIPLLRIRSKAIALHESVRYTKDGLALQDYPQLQRGVARLGGDLEGFESNYKKLSWLKVIPWVRSYYLDGQAFILAGADLISAGDKFLNILAPFAPTLGFKTQESIVTLGGQERIAGLIKAMPQVAGQLDAVKIDIVSGSQKLSRVNTNRYPETMRGYKIRSTLESVKSTLDSLAQSGPDLEDILNTLPRIMGDQERKVYLVLFQNDKEIRPTGGFWTAYALLGVEQGRIVSAQSGDMYFLDIDNRVSYYPPAPAPIANYLKLDKWYIRDSNLSPDYKESVETMLEFWNRVPGVPDLDGVIAVDTYFVEGLLKIVGPISLPGFKEPFSAENVVYQLEEYSNVLMKHSGERKDVLGSLMSQMIAKIFALPSNSYNDLLNTGVALLAEKHILLYFVDGLAQELSQKYNLAGRITEFSGDYLHINDANFGGRKANWYMEQTVAKKVYRQGDNLLCDLELVYKNIGDYDSEWNTGYRDYMRILVPSGSQLISGSGGLEPFTSFNDLGKTVFATFLGVGPKETTVIKVTYKLPKEIIQDGQYKLHVQKQPGTQGFSYKIDFLGKEESIVLNKDTIVSF